MNKLYLRSFIAFFISISSIISYAQITTSTQWTWVKGDNILDVPGVYGTKGVFNTANKPGARDGAVSWTDNAGNFWLFGGTGFGTTRSVLNDLWKYDIATNRWAWMSGSNDVNAAGDYGTFGVPSNTNTPGSRRYSISWTDLSGNLWLFGGEGFTPGNSFGFLNDLWKYNPLTNQWTWISGDAAPDQTSEFGTQGVSDPNNKPGSRSGSSSWIDASGKLWFFGGLSYNFPTPAYSDDLWRFNIATGEWTWMKGNFVLNSPGIYGTKSIANINNNPGGRHDAAEWADGNGNFWLFGGEGLDEVNGNGSLNDLWKYNISTNTWTWMTGDKVIDQAGIYGTQGTPSALNSPGARFQSYPWRDPAGIFYLFGGDGYGTSSQGLLNDLWKYDVALNQWTWLKGDGNVNVNSVYGTQGTSTPTTKPGSRRGGVTFRDAAGNLWLFGGNGYDGSGGTDLLNDLWRLGTATVVPVTGLKLMATRDPLGINLKWQTEQEFNMDHFEIQRSADGISFAPIGNVHATGNTTSRHNYNYSDNAPLPATNFYRIKAFDQQGFSYSNIIALSQGERPLKLFPNPVTDILYVQATGIHSDAVLNIFDEAGRTVISEKITGIGNFSISLNVRSLPEGMYILKIQNKEGNLQQQFIKH